MPPASSGVRHASGRSALRSAWRWCRDAAIGLALITSVPLVAIEVRGTGNAMNGADELAARIAQIEPLRALRLPESSDLAPQAAAGLWNATVTGVESAWFPQQPAAREAERAWEALTLTDDMFSGVDRVNTHLLRSVDILRLAASPLSAAEAQYLRTVAEAPIWLDVDQLASLSTLDVIGARYVLPFRGDASPLLMPIPRFAATKELAYAGLSRAAWHLAQGDPARAEHALRSVLSFGFLMIDNGPSVIEGAIGRVIVGIANDGLRTLYTVTGNEVGQALTQLPDAPNRDRAAVRAPGDEATLIATIRNPAAPRTARLQSVWALSMLPCTSARGVLLGHSTEAEAAFDEARRTLARYPSEVALIDLLEDAPNRLLPDDALLLNDAGVDRLLSSAAAVAAAVLQNPRLQACSSL